MWESHSRSEGLVAEELIGNGRLCVTDISRRAHLPTWAVSRVLKRLEIRGYVHCEVEDRQKRGRPRKFYKFTDGESESPVVEAEVE